MFDTGFEFLHFNFCNGGGSVVLSGKWEVKEGRGDAGLSSTELSRKLNSCFHGKASLQITLAPAQRESRTRVSLPLKEAILLCCFEHRG